jgi:hypothetical protein
MIWGVHWVIMGWTEGSRIIVSVPPSGIVLSLIPLYRLLTAFTGHDEMDIDGYLQL